MAHETSAIPIALSDLPAGARHPLLRAGLDKAKPARICPLEAEIAKSKEHIRRCEARYNPPFPHFKAEILFNLDTSDHPKIHTHLHHIHIARGVYPAHIWSSTGAS